MQLTCRQCGRTIPPEDIDIQRIEATCRSCGEVFGFGSSVANASQPVGGKSAVEKPRDYTLSHDGGDLVISWRWFGVSLVRLLLLTLIWDAVLLAGSLFLARGTTFAGNMDGILLLFPGLLLFYGAGIGLTVWSVYACVNRTTLRVNRTRLAVQHGPLPWSGNVSIPAEEIDQLFCEEKAFYGTLHYRVVVILRSGGRVILFFRLRQMRQAAYIEQQVEQHLGIADRPVDGEMLLV